MAKYKIDAAHSEVLFNVRHLMISKVSGQFNSFEGELEAEKEDFSDAQFKFEAAINSISTNNTQRDEHLKSADFFDETNHPKLSFISTSYDGKTLQGNLTIKGVTKNVQLSTTYEGKMMDFYGNEKHGFEFKGKINRKDFGLEWNAVTEAGGIVVSDEVNLIINAQFNKEI